MTDATDPSELIRRGQAAARIGARDQARRYLCRAVELAPGRADGWLALAAVEDDPEEKIACLQTVLSLDPENDEALLGLEMLRELQASPAAAQQPGDEMEAVIAEASRRLEQAVGPASDGKTPLDDDVLYCANHPGVETVLRCNRCGKPICTRCAVPTPVGYRCRECVGQQRAVYFTGGPVDYVVGGVISAVLGGIASTVATMLRAGFFGLFFAFILGPAVGVGIAEVVRWAVRRRRTPYLWLAVAIGMIVGSLPAILLLLLGLNLYSILTVGLFLALAISAASARLR
jgi:hypothetical protein